MDLSELKALENLEKNLKKVQPSNNENCKYYYQNLVTKDLGISTPPNLKGLNTVLGWGSAAVDILHERTHWRGFWSPENTASDITEWLNSLYRSNFMEVQQKQHQRDAFITGASYLSIAPGDEEAGEPEVLWMNESPLNTYGQFNYRTLGLDNCVKIIKKDDEIIATLWLPNSTIVFKKNKTSDNWLEHSRDDHELGVVTVVPITNNADSRYKRGKTEISRSLKGYTDSAMRTLLGAELAREFAVQPLKAILGADAADFIDENGQPLNTWDLITGKIINVPYNSKEGILPTLMNIQSGNPQNVMQLIETYGRLAATEIGVPPSQFGFETTNPSSADAMIEANRKIINRAEMRIPALKMAYKKAAEFSLLLTNQDKPEDWSTLEAVFMRPDTITPQASADRIVKLSSMGLFDKPMPTFVYREVGLSEVEIKEIQEFLTNQSGQDLVKKLIESNTPVVPGG